MRDDELLFYGGSLADSLHHQLTKVVDEVKAVPEQHLLQAVADDWVEGLVAKWHVQRPIIQREGIWLTEPKEVQVDVSNDQMRFIVDSRYAHVAGWRTVIHIPFEGEEDVFKLKASTWSLNQPRANVKPGEVYATLEYPHDRQPDVRAYVERLVDNLETHLGYAAADVDRYNGQIAEVARNAIEERRRRILEGRAHICEAGFPIGAPSTGTPTTYIADAIVRRPAPKLPTSAKTPIPLEPILADKVFDHIVEVIQTAGRDMERAPAAYEAMDEEARRQVILMALNTHYRGATTAEAFNYTGKTDLLIKHEGRNLFVGECKIWSGTSAFSDTVDQLFRYVTWRDSKLALVMFVRAKGLSDVVAKARDALADHAQFVEWKQAPDETTLRCTTTWPGDPDKRCELAAVFIHTPASS